MICWKEDNYGADADGNRGITIYNYDLEDTEDERDEISELLFDSFIDGRVSGKITIYMYCCILKDDIEVEVRIEDYTEELLTKARQSMSQEEYYEFITEYGLDDE